MNLLSWDIYYFRIDFLEILYSLLDQKIFTLLFSAFKFEAIFEKKSLNFSATKLLELIVFSSLSFN